MPPGMSITNVMPDRVVLRALGVGVQALVANPDLIDTILTSLTDEELTKVKEHFVRNAPEVFRGYPRYDKPFPQFSLTLMADQDHTEFVGESDADVLNEADVKVDVSRQRRRVAVIGLLITDIHIDLCAYLAMIAKRIIEAATLRFQLQGLDLPRITVNDLVPMATQASEQVFQRQLQLSIEYNDVWSTTDALWIALNGDPEAYVTDPEKVDAFRSDVFFTDEDGDEFGGTVVSLEDE